MSKWEYDRLIEPTKNEDFQRQQKKREERLKELMAKRQPEEINPKYNHYNEPVCSGEGNCLMECGKYEHDIEGNYIRVHHPKGHPCIPALCRDRDAALERVKHLENAIYMAAEESMIDEQGVFCRYCLVKLDEYHTGHKKDCVYLSCIPKKEGE